MTLYLVNRFCLSLLAVLAINGCSSSISATAKFNGNFDFNGISSYSTFDRNSDFSDFQNISDATRNGIELAIEQVLDDKGFDYQASKDADIIIAYHLINRGKELKTYNQGVKFCGPCLRGGQAKRNKKAWQMLPGSLILDVVDTKKHRSIWRSVFPLSVKQDDNSFEVQEKIYNAINKMMKALPKKVG